MAYQPIQDYGIIGNMRTSALVSLRGSIDWMCFPRFDSPSIFASLLDDQRGGHFSIGPSGEAFTPKQLYWSETNVLVTRFLAPEGVGEVIDFMPVGVADLDPETVSVVRRVSVTRGSMEFTVRCVPAFDYARGNHEVRVSRAGAVFHSEAMELALHSNIHLHADGAGVSAKFTLNEGQTAVFVLGRHVPDSPHFAQVDERTAAYFDATVCYWRRWIARSTYVGRWREIVQRSALVLKLLTYEPTGAIVAAPTCSLPESIGGRRNWDYRYSWMRDAAFTIYGLMRIGFTDEARRFMEWVRRCYDESDDGSVRIMYGIDFSTDLTEHELTHLSGYRGSNPVRVGNAAHKQLQLDVYGELMDAIYLSNKYAMAVSFEAWQDVRRILNWLETNWQQPDEGIWEVRGGKHHFVYSRLMCWVAFDRGIRLAEKRSFPAELERWRQARDAIYTEIMEHGYNKDMGCFVQSYGSTALDASVLMMPLVFFISPTDPRMISTLRAINRRPADGGLVSDGLVFRYDTASFSDGVAGNEGTFNLCTFWLVEALTRAGRADPALLHQAQLIFERMLGYANHLGLYAEQTGPSGEALGNFPQAFTHLSLISAAYNLDRALQRPSS